MPAAKILFVEDEPLLAFSIEMMLEEAGYVVTTVGNGAGALLELENAAIGFDLLLTDVRLPGSVDGWRIAKRARELFPQLPVIYASGDSAKDWKARGVPGSYMLNKPFPLDEAKETVRGILIGRK